MFESEIKILSDCAHSRPAPRSAVGVESALGSQHRAVVVSVSVVSEVPAERWFIADVGSVPLSLHYVDRGIVTDVSALHAASILTVE